LLLPRLKRPKPLQQAAETSRDAALLQLSAPPGVLVTAHRRESWGGPLERIARSVLKIARSCPDVGVLSRCAHFHGARHSPARHLDDALLIEPEPYGSFVRPLWNSLIWYSLIPAESRPVSARD
jgi:UDP-N-acetylglucosamine 2-epimerase